ncbi:MAG: hypothetical protein IKP47_07990 [Ruminococcus sp.]|nr:hypothetical protein [Ruminococcus sp.]
MKTPNALLCAALAALVMLMPASEGLSEIPALEDTAPQAAKSAVLISKTENSNITVFVPSDASSEDAAEEVVSEPEVTVDEVSGPADPIDEGFARRAEEVREAAEAEKAFLARNPDLAELGEHIPEGSTEPIAVSDPGFHKYIAKLMEQERYASTASLTGMCLPMLNISAAAVSGSAALVHQDRFSDCTLTYGTDVSYFQGNIDWKKVKAAGIDFCILRAGYRGYGKAGTLVLDEKFLTNYKNAKAAGLKVGAYFFTQAITTAEAKAEADFVYSYIKNFQFDLPIYCDMEEITYDTGRLDSANLTKAQKTAIIMTFCDRMIELGFNSGVYSNPSWLYNKIERTKLEAKYPIWLANYTTKTTYEYKFDIWQYGLGYIDGIYGQTDMDVRYTNAVPGTITGLKAENLGGGKVKLSWDPLGSGVTGYCVRSKKPSAVVSSIAASTSNNYVILTLDKGSIYTLSVNGTNTTANGSVSGPLSFIYIAVNDAPAEFACTADSEGFTASWQPVNGASGYNIYIKEDGGEPVLAGSCTGTSFKCSCDPGDHTVYATAFVTGSSASYEGAFTDGVKIRVEAGKFELAEASFSSLTLGWDEIKSAQSFKVYGYNEATGEKTLMAELPGDARSYSVTGLPVCARYSFVIEVLYTDGISCFSQVISGITRPGPVGDVNSDGVLNMKDIAILKKYLHTGQGNIEPANADVDRNGVIDEADLTCLKEKLVGSSEKLI